VSVNRILLARRAYKALQLTAADLCIPVGLNQRRGVQPARAAAAKRPSPGHHGSAAAGTSHAHEQ
jgi:hypothetical protein